MLKQVLPLSIGVCWLVLSILYTATDAVELIELNDANRNALPLDVSKSLETVQLALSNEYKFNSVAEAEKFVDKCKYLSASVNDLTDAEYNGLAGKIKSILSEPELSDLCKITSSEFAEFEVLDETKEDAYLSRKTLAALVSLGESLDAQPKMKRVLGHSYETKTRNMGKKMLANAAYDTTVFFGELSKAYKFLDYEYLAGCEINSIKPICKLIRRSDRDDVAAIGADVADFRDALVSNNQEVINRHEQASGVTVDELKDSCNNVLRDLHPMQQVNGYLKANFVTEQQVEEQSKLDEDFAFYYELERLCETQASK